MAKRKRKITKEEIAWWVYLAMMTALKFAIANVGMRQSREVDDEDLRQLEKIGTEIDAYLNDPKK